MHLPIQIWLTYIYTVNIMDGLLVHRYNSKLREAQVTNTLKGLAVGVNFGVIYFLIFVCYAIAFW